MLMTLSRKRNAIRTIKKIERVLEECPRALLFAYFKELFSSSGFTIFEGELDAQGFGVALA